MEIGKKKYKKSKVKERVAKARMSLILSKGQDVSKVVDLANESIMEGKQVSPKKKAHTTPKYLLRNLEPSLTEGATLSTTAVKKAAKKDVTQAKKQIATPKKRKARKARKAPIEESKISTMSKTPRRRRRVESAESIELDEQMHYEPSDSAEPSPENKGPDQVEEGWIDIGQDDQQQDNVLEHDEEKSQEMGHAKSDVKKKCRLRVKCRGCKYSNTRRNLARHLRRHSECRVKYYNKDGSPRAVLLRLGIGTRWRRDPKFDHEYVLVKRDQLELLEDAFSHVYYKLRMVLSLEDYKSKPTVKPKSETEKEDEFASFSEKEAYDRAAKILKDYIGNRTRLSDNRNERLEYLRNLSYSISKLEELFDAQYRKYKYGPSICDYPDCDILSPECVSVIVDIDREKALDICSAYKRETEVLKSLDLATDSPVPSFETKRDELVRIKLKYDQEASSISDALDGQLKSNTAIKKLQAKIKDIKDKNTGIREKMGKEEMKVYENELTIQLLNGEINKKQAEMAGSQTEKLSKLCIDARQLGTRIKIIESIINKKARIPHEHAKDVGKNSSVFGQLAERHEAQVRAKRVLPGFDIPT